MLRASRQITPPFTVRMPRSETMRFGRGPVNPIARSTRSAFHTRPEPGFSVITGRPPPGGAVHATSTVDTASTAPPEPVNALVATFQCRSQPSLWLLDVRSMFGHCGQGVASARAGGGCGRISTCVTEAAPCRMAVPTQSDPVSPPPMTSTDLPRADISRCGSTVSPARRRFCWTR